LGRDSGGNELAVVFTAVLDEGGWPIFSFHCTNSHEGCPILAFLARACPELAEGVGGDDAGATFVRSTPPVAYPSCLFAKYAKDGAPASAVASAVGTPGHPHHLEPVSAQACLEDQC
jgi:hypothetical protein